MNFWIRFLGVCLLVMIIAGCAVKQQRPLPESSSSVPAMGEKEIQPEPMKMEPTVSKTIAKVGAHRLNLRQKGSSKSRIIAVLKKGDALEILSRTGNWLEVKTQAKVHGWVYRRYITGFEEVVAQPSNGANEQTPKKKITKIKTDSGVSTIITEDLKSDPSAAKSEQSIQEQKTPPASNALQKELENVLEAYLKANRSGDLKQYKEMSSAHSYATMENTMASTGKALTADDITAMAEFLPDPSELEFVEMFKNGPTAGLVYVKEVKDVDNPNIPSPLKFSFIKFVQEPSGWKVDGMLTTGKPKYQKDGSETRFKLSDIPDELAIDGKVPEAPQAMAKAEIKGVIDVSSYGYKTEVTINGIKQSGANDSNSSGHIEGGLKKGENQIDIVISPIEGAGSDWEPSIKIRYLSTAGEEKEAFSFEPEKDFEGRHHFNFNIIE